VFLAYPIFGSTGIALGQNCEYFLNKHNSKSHFREATWISTIAVFRVKILYFIA
jgi:hypothetical protein